MENADFEAHLEAMLAETEETARELRVELRELRSQREEGARRAAQHAEIERLEEHLAQTRVDWAKVRQFLEEAVRELRDKRKGSEA